MKNGEYYLVDLCKCRIIKDGTAIGHVKSICEGGADDLLEIVTEKGTVLVPFLDKFIGEVNLEAGTIDLKDDWLLQ